MKNTAPRCVRSGVATLELCLALPLLLLVMALFINAGTSAAWKVRAQGVARDAVWRHRWPREGTKPQPGGWPDDAQVSYSALGDASILDDPAIDHPVTQGPMIGQINVNQECLDMPVGARRGAASIERERPLLTALGSMQYNVDHSLFDVVWSWEQTRSDELELRSNNSRRIKVLYDMQECELGEWLEYGNAVGKAFSATQTTNLLPLTYRLRKPNEEPPPQCDDTNPSSYPWNLPVWRIQWQRTHYDPDFGRLRYPPMGYYPKSPEFHPGLGGFQNLTVAEDKVTQLIDRIKGTPQNMANSVPGNMAKSYISLYKGAISTVEKHLEILQALDPQPTAQIAAVQAILDARKSELEPKIKELEAFRDELSAIQAGGS